MNKHLPIYLYGTILVFVGFFLIFSERLPFQIIRITLGISSIVGAVFAFISALARNRQQVAFSYHEMHALAMLVFGISILLFCDTFEKIVPFTAFLFLFYAVSELIFSNWLFNLKQKIVFSVLATRVILGLLIGIGTVIALSYAKVTIQLFGVMFILVGINVIMYVQVMKVNPVKFNHLQE